MLIIVYKKKEINQTKMRRDTGNYAQLRRDVVLCLTDISLRKNSYPFLLDIPNSLGEMIGLERANIEKLYDALCWR